MKPIIHKSTFVDKSAVILGNVKIGKNCGIYPNAVIRGDQNIIEIGDESNIQDCCVIHCDQDNSVKIGNKVTIGHCAMIHGATIEDECLIGIHATVLNGAKIGKGSIVGANALVKEGMQVPQYSLVIGIPGEIIKKDKGFIGKSKKNAEEYLRILKMHKEKIHDYYMPQD